MTNKAFIVGVGMIPFVKPGANEPYPTVAQKVGRLALDDAGITYDAMNRACVGYVYGDATAGQKALYDLRAGVGALRQGARRVRGDDVSLKLAFYTPASAADVGGKSGV